MAMSEHPAQPDLHGERRERVDERAPGQLVRDPVGQSGARIARASNSWRWTQRRNGPLNLFVDEQPLRLVVGVARQPADDAGDSEFHFGAALDAYRFVAPRAPGETPGSAGPARRRARENRRRPIPARRSRPA